MLHLTLWIVSLNALCSAAAIIPRQAGLIVHHELSGTNLASARNVEEFALRQRASVHSRYNGGESPNDLQKRGVTDTNLGNKGADAQYFLTLFVGTPPISLNLIGDTGSSDLWMATSPCIKGCVAETPLYDPSLSNTSTTSQAKFKISYVIGSADGLLVSDRVSIAGLPSVNQIFGAVTNSTSALSGNIAGILGLGFTATASSRATPLLQAYAQGGALDANMFSFALRRFNNVSNAQDVIEAGGTLTIGGTNPLLHDPFINYVPLSGNATDWLVPLDTITINGVDLKISAISTAIDTGTSLIAGPQAACDAIYGAIPGATPFNISGVSGYYAYPCATQVKLSFTFGGIAYAMDPVDFNSGQLNSDSPLCLGAIFVYPTNTLDGTTTWIIGDSFLKNVYSVYRFSPNPAVGFSTLSANFKNLNNNPLASSAITTTATTNPPRAATTSPAATASLAATTSTTPKSTASLSNGFGSIWLSTACSVGAVLLLLL